MAVPKPKLCTLCRLARMRGQRSRETEEAAACCDVGGDIVPKEAAGRAALGVGVRACMCVRGGNHLSRQAAEASHLALSEAVVWLAKPQRQPWRQRRRAVAARL